MRLHPLMSARLKNGIVLGLVLAAVVTPADVADRDMGWYRLDQGAGLIGATLGALIVGLLIAGAILLVFRRRNISLALLAGLALVLGLPDSKPKGPIAGSLPDCSSEV